MKERALKDRILKLQVFIFGSLVYFVRDNVGRERSVEFLDFGYFTNFLLSP